MARQLRELGQRPAAGGQGGGDSYLRRPLEVEEPVLDLFAGDGFDRRDQRL